MQNKTNLINLLRQGLPNNIIGYYLYGSYVYGTNSKKSDIDFILVDADQKTPEQQLKDYPIEFTIYSKDKFQEMLNSHDVSALECVCLPETHIIINKFEIPKIDLSILRSSISRTASNSFVKCKKKLKIEKETYIGKKSLWHSLRILMFGTQIAKYGKIIDYTEANSLWEEIAQLESNEWSIYKEKYKPIYNKISTEFKKYAPKENKKKNT